MVAHRQGAKPVGLNKLFLVPQAGTSFQYQPLTFYLFKNMWFSAIPDVKTLASEGNGL